MAPSLKNLLGNGSRDTELAEEMRNVLQQMQQERSRNEALLQSIEAATARLSELGEPIAKAGGDVDAVASRLNGLEQRFNSLSDVASQFQGLETRATEFAQRQQHAESQVASSIEDAQKIRSAFDEIGGKIDQALDLKDRLGAFLDVEKPFQQIKGDAETLRNQVENTTEQLVRLREQHDRLIDAHKLAMSKMEALDRRRDDLGRGLQDKERRVENVEAAVRGMDGVQQTVDSVKREVGTLKALSDSVVQRTAALEGQRDAVDRALAQAENLERAMRQLDAGIRHQQENEKALATLHDHVASLTTLHEAVIDRSSEISQLQRETDEQTRLTRQNLASMTDEMRTTVERFDFESRGLESVSERVADLRSSLTDFEQRYKTLSEARQAVIELKGQTQASATQLHTLAEEIGHVEREIVQLRAIRRDLDATGTKAREVGTQVERIEELRPGVEVALKDIERLSGTHALVKDAIEQTQIAHQEVLRVRQSQTETNTWLTGVEQTVDELEAQVRELNSLAPAIEHALKQAQRVGDATQTIETRREFVDDLHRRLAELGALAARLDERAQQLHQRMETAEQRFVAFGTHSEEAERMGLTVSTVASTLNEAAKRTSEIEKTVATIVTRCEAVEELEERTRALRPELEQRQQALKEAAKDLQRATNLRKEAANSAQQLETVAKQLNATIAQAGVRAEQVDELSAHVEDRAANLQQVESRLARFEARLTEWDPVEQEISRSLEQIGARQGTIEALQADLDRMLVMVEKTAGDVREITSAHSEIEQSRILLKDVMTKLVEVRDTAKGLDERKRQMAQAESRLSRAEGLLADVQSSVEALQAQKAIVEQAVEKTGSLQFLLKQAEGAMEGLREEREMTTRVRGGLTLVRSEDVAVSEDDEADVRAA